MSAIAQPLPVKNEERVPWISMVWFFALLVLCYAPVLWRLVNQWNNDEDMGHGFFVPVIAAYIAWQSRDKLFASGIKGNYWGLALVFFAGLQLYLATLGAELFTTRVAFIESLAGVILFLGGTAAIRILAFPLLLL